MYSSRYICMYVWMASGISLVHSTQHWCTKNAMSSQTVRQCRVSEIPLWIHTSTYFNIVKWSVTLGLCKHFLNWSVCADCDTISQLFTNHNVLTPARFLGSDLIIVENHKVYVSSISILCLSAIFQREIFHWFLQYVGLTYDKRAMLLEYEFTFGKTTLLQ